MKEFLHRGRLSKLNWQNLGKYNTMKNHSDAVASRNRSRNKKTHFKIDFRVQEARHKAVLEGQGRTNRIQKLAHTRRITPGRRRWSQIYIKLMCWTHSVKSPKEPYITRIRSNCQETSRGARHGKPQEQIDHFRANASRRIANKKRYSLILDRFQKYALYRNSQIAIVSTEDKFKNLDSLQLEDKSYTAPREEKL